MRVKRLYRVTAIFPGTTTRRDYQTKAAAEYHAEVLAAARIPVAALSVTVTKSDPITWPKS
jgi:hypothetical protein